MSSITERTPVQMGLMVGLLGLVGTVFYQQGLINGRAPKDGEYVRSDVFGATMNAQDAKLGSLEKTVDLRLAAVEKELARLSRIIEEGKDAQEHR